MYNSFLKSVQFVFANIQIPLDLPHNSIDEHKKFAQQAKKILATADENGVHDSQLIPEPLEDHLEVEEWGFREKFDGDLSIKEDNPANDAIARMQASFGKLGRTLATEVAGPLEKTSNFISDLIPKTGEFVRGSGATLGAGLTELFLPGELVPTLSGRGRRSSGLSQIATDIGMDGERIRTAEKRKQIRALQSQNKLQEEQNRELEKTAKLEERRTRIMRERKFDMRGGLEKRMQDRFRREVIEMFGPQAFLGPEPTDTLFATESRLLTRGRGSDVPKQILDENKKQNERLQRLEEYERRKEQRSLDSPLWQMEEVS